MTFNSINSVHVVFLAILDELKRTQTITVYMDEALNNARDYINNTDDLDEEGIHLAIAYMTEICIYKLKKNEALIQA